jgi:4-hydroxy-tetrahydrodipicolinate synthase
MKDIVELRKHVRGVDVVLVTPFQDDGDIDVNALKANVQWLVEFGRGKDVFLTALGTFGECYALNDDETRLVTKTVVEQVQGRLPVFVGTGRPGTKATVELCKYAESVGADGVLVIHPYYMTPSVEGMYQHYETIAQSIKIGVMIYNFAEITKSWIDPRLMVRLSQIENIVAVKENTQHIGQYYQMQRALDPDKIAILAGLGEMVFPFEALYPACKGFVSGLANFAPQLSYDLYEGVSRGDLAKVRQLVERIGIFHTFVGKVSAAHGPCPEVLPTPHGVGSMLISSAKHAMDLVGLDGGKVRLPLTELTAQEHSELRDVLVVMGLSVT